MVLFFYHREPRPDYRRPAFSLAGLSLSFGLFFRQDDGPEARMKKNSLSWLLKHGQKHGPKKTARSEQEIEALQLALLRIQQGIWHGKGRVILLFEGFDAAGKGGCIRTLTERLDPRGVKVHAIGPPKPEEQERHWLYRFWQRIPEPGTIAIFDRSWYGRLLVEKVEKLAPSVRIRDAYREINEFERSLQRDGITLMKFFLAVSKEEQLRRFADRLKDPYKQWKLTEDDIRASEHWNGYVKAVDKLLEETKGWDLVPADNKHVARAKVLTAVKSELKPWGKWIEKQAASLGARSIDEELRKLKKKT